MRQRGWSGGGGEQGGLPEEIPVGSHWSFFGVVWPSRKWMALAMWLQLDELGDVTEIGMEVTEVRPPETAGAVGGV